MDKLEKFKRVEIEKTISDEEKTSLNSNILSMELRETPIFDKPSAIKFKSRKFMFPAEKKTAYVDFGEYEKRKSGRKNISRVSFADLVELCLIPNSEYSKRRNFKWTDPVYILCETSTMQILTLIDSLELFSIRHPEFALEYWTEFQKAEKTVLYSPSQRYSRLNNAFLLIPTIVGRVPLHNSIKFEDIDPETSAYKTLPSYFATPTEQLIDTKQRGDVKGLKEFVSKLKVSLGYRKSTENNVLRLSSTESVYSTQFVAMSEVMEKSRTKRDFESKDSPFVNFLTGFMTIKRAYKALTARNSTETFKRFFGSPMLDPRNGEVSDELYKKVMNYLAEVFQVLDDVTERLNRLKNHYETHRENISNAAVGLSCQLKNFGKIVVDKGDCYYQDVFSGSLLVKTKEREVYKYYVHDIKVNGKVVSADYLAKLEKELEFKIKVGEELPEPEVILGDEQEGSQFLELCTVLGKPADHIEEMYLLWMQLYIETFNRAIQIATMNDNLNLLQILVEKKFHNLIIELSKKSAPLFPPGQGAVNQKSLLRAYRKRNPFYKFLPKFLTGKQTILFNSAYNVQLKPILRADFDFSMNKRCCANGCTGHRNMLLLSAIRLGCFYVIPYLIQQGLSRSEKVCSSEAVSFSWERKVSKTNLIVQHRRKTKKLRRQKQKQVVLQVKAVVPLSNAENKNGTENMKTPLLSSATPPVAASNSSSLVTKKIAAKPFELKKQQAVTDENAKEALPIVQKPVLKPNLPKLLINRHEADKQNICADDKIYIQSKFKTHNSLTVAVASLLAQTSNINQRTHARKTKVFQSLEEFEVCTERFELVQNLLNAKVKVLDCDAAAVRALLPVVVDIAKAARSQVKKGKKVDLNLFQFSRHSSVLDRLESIQNKALELYKMSKKHKTKQKKERSPQELETEFNAAFISLEVFKLVTRKAIKEMKKNRKKDKTFFPVVVLRSILLQEALMKKEWNTVRFLCPYKVDKEKSVELKEKYSSFDKYESTYKVIDVQTGETILRTIRVLLKELQVPKTTSNLAVWEALYFLLREYNLSLSRGLYYETLACFKVSTTSCVDLRVGEAKMIQKVFLTSGFRKFIVEGKVLPERDIYNFCQSEPQKCPINLFKHFGTKGYNCYDIQKSLYSFAFAQDLPELLSLLTTEASVAEDKEFLKELVQFCLLKKKLGCLVPKLIRLCDGLFSETLENFHPISQVFMYLLTSEVPTRLTCNVLLDLFKANYTPPSRTACVYFLTTCMKHNPLIQPKEGKQKLPMTQDMSQAHICRVLFDFLFVSSGISESDAKKKFYSILEQSVVTKNMDNVWVQGLAYFIKWFGKIYDLRKDQVNPEAVLARTINWIIPRLNNTELVFDEKTKHFHLHKRKVKQEQNTTKNEV